MHDDLVVINRSLDSDNGYVGPPRPSGARMKKIQVQGVHHTTIVGSTRQSAIDFWEGVLGMPFVIDVVVAAHVVERTDVWVVEL
jgi:hypothetical protein